MTARSLKKDALMTACLTVIGRSLGFLIPVLLANWYGANEETDAFFLAYGVLLFITTALGGVFETAVVPFFTDFRDQKKEIGKFMGFILLRITLIMSILTILLLMGYKPFVMLTTKLSMNVIGLSFHLFLLLTPILFFEIWTDGAD